jgi:aerotaxis receptor
MRTNLPVSDVEYPLTDETLIVSKTDLKGKLTYFNEQFVAASGFADAELMGQPHNIIRHPDMPPEAFADLWVTLKAGKPWAGAVKNRRKNGDFYWVLASATPIWENGQVTGYMSIRSKLPADQREEAEHVYALLRAKKAHAYTVTAGIIRRRSLADRFAVFTRTLKARLVTLVGCLIGFLLVVGLTGILAAYSTDNQLQSLYHDRLIRMSELAEINVRMQDNVLLLYSAAADGLDGKKDGNVASKVSGNTEAINKAFEKLAGAASTVEDKALTATLTEKRREFVEQGLKPGLALLSAGKFDELSRHLAEKAGPLFAPVKAAGDKLAALQLSRAKNDYENAEYNFKLALGAAIGFLIAGLVLGGLLGMQAIRAIGRPIERLVGVMAKIAQGLFNSRIQIERDDELGVALRNMQAMQSKLGFDREEQKDTEKRVAVQRKLDMHKLANDFEGAVGEIIETVSSAATELEASAGTLTATAEHAQELSTKVATASEEASTNVQSVASATEELTSSVNEISRQVQESARMANEAVDQARTTNDRVSELSKAASRIGDVVELINTIAGQTNLLALNATIEAARAGEAGRGFAVVASEVKALAEQTAKATGEIGQQISGIQAATHESVDAIKTISGTIEKLSEISSTIAAAVEEQGAATQEISRNVQQAALGTQQVSSNITDVQRGASETGSASSQVFSAAQSLSGDSNRLKLEVGKFLNTVRAA